MQAAITSAVPVVSVTVPGRVQPAASAAAVWSIAPATTGMFGGRPSSAAGPGSREPAGAPHSSSSGSSSADAPAAARPLCHNPSLCRSNQPVEVCRDFSLTNRPVSQWSR